MNWLDQISRFWPHLAAGFDFLAALLASVHALLHKRDSRATTLWIGFMAPKGTPQPIVDLLNRNITDILKRPDIKAAWESQGATPLAMTQADFSAFMQAQVDKWAKVIRDNHIALIN